MSSPTNKDIMKKLETMHEDFIVVKTKVNFHDKMFWILVAGLIGIAFKVII